MLDGLDDIDWSALNHAYGPAGDVPDCLRSLLDPDRREDAVWTLYATVFHQGTRYPATPHVLPFLLELVQAGVARRELVVLTRHLVAGYFFLTSSGNWCDGETLHQWDGTPLAVAEAPDDVRYDTHPAVLADIWRRAAAAAPTWIGLLDDEDPPLRSEVAVLLALLTGVDGVADALRARLAREPVGAVRADLVFALSHADEAVVRAHLHDPDAAVRFVAAVCLTDALDVVVAGLHGVDGFEAVRCRGEDPAPSVAAHALGRAPREAVLPAVPAILEALAGQSGFAVMPLVQVLLQAAFPEPLDEATPDPLQRQVLEGLVAHPHLWTVGNLWQDFREAGVPHDRARVAALLGAEVPDDRGVREVEHGLTFARMGFTDKALEHFDAVPDAETFDAHPRALEAWRCYAEALARTPGREADAERVRAEVAARRG